MRSITMRKLAIAALTIILLIALKVLLFGFMAKVSIDYRIPENFVHLKDIDPTIQQDIRYHSHHNFIGHPIKGYLSPTCILTKPAAQALAKVQHELLKQNLTLKVYDCYRPQMAVDEFITWSSDPADQKMKAEFYPRVDKKNFFKLGYVAEKSSHSRGSTVDLTIMPNTTPTTDTYKPGQALVACTAPYGKRFKDGSIDMGTGYDCMDELSHSSNQSLNKTALKNRKLLSKLMQENGFKPYPEEWWHFTLKSEPFPDTYFNFLVK